MADDTPTTSNKQTIATVSALVLGVAGALGWIKPPDNSAAIKTYDTTKAAIQQLEAKHAEDFKDVHARQHEIERWIARRLAEIDRDRIPDDDDDTDVDEPGHYEPPPLHKRDKPPRPAAHLPPAQEFIE